MKFITTLLAVVATVASVSAAPTSTNQPKGLFKLDPGSKPGWYTHHLALDGSVVTKYHGEAIHTHDKPHTNGTTPTQTPPSSALHKRAPYGIYCQTLTFTEDDGQAAITGLANALNANNQFYHATSYSSGTAVAYGCDYGHGQTISGPSMQSYLSMIQNQCGNTKAGWFSIPDWKASYGITTTGQGFC